VVLYLVRTEGPMQTSRAAALCGFRAAVVAFDRVLPAYGRSASTRTLHWDIKGVLSHAIGCAVPKATTDGRACMWLDYRAFLESDGSSVFESLRIM
jgi:hypothetical protein